MVVEVSFPRGGRKPNQTIISKHIKDDFDLFGSQERHIKKKKKGKGRNSNKKQEENEEFLSEDVQAADAELINYRTVQNGMVLLGCIREVQKMTIGVNLPGRLSGRVNIANISNSYNELLQSIVDDKISEDYKPLKDVYSPGQYVAVKVINKEENDNKCNIGLSLKPQHVNSHLSHTSLVTGMILWGAICSKEEHGFIVDLGISNCRAFLQNANIEEGKEYVVGEVNWFTVQKLQSTSTATTVSLNALNKKINSMKIFQDVMFDDLQPGMKVDFTIAQHCENGLEGKFLNGYTGYIHKMYLKSAFDTLKNYNFNNIIEARIIYIMPITKLAFLTLRSLEPHNRGDISDGMLTNCIIHSVTQGGLYVQLETNTDKKKGFVSYRRLKSNLPLNSEIDDFTHISNQYPVQSNHRCRILSYDYFEQVYICSLEEELLKKMIFTINDLEIGQEVTAEVVAIQQYGLLVHVDRVNCFIKDFHITDLILDSYHNIKSKFKVGQQIKARVWLVNKEENLCQLTMKPSLMKADNLVIKSFEELTANKQTAGIIYKISAEGIKIGFFNEIFGWVPRNEIGSKKHYKVGQYVPCIVKDFDVDEKKILLSLKSPGMILLKIGQHVTGTVTNVFNDGIEVKIKDLNIIAFIPLIYLTKFPNLAHILAGMYEPGTVLKNLVCIKPFKKIPILSQRDTDLNKNNIPNLKTLKVNTLFAASIQSINNKKMLIHIPIIGYNKNATVSLNNIVESGDVNNIDIKLNQFVVAKVLEINNPENKSTANISATVKLRDCWDFNLQDSIDRLCNYLETINHITNYFKSISRPLASLNLGKLVKGVVQERTEFGYYIIKLENGDQGIVHPNHVKENITIGEKVKGIVLWLNFCTNFAEIVLCPKLISRINQNQDEKINIKLKKNRAENKVSAEVLLVHEDFTLVVIRDQVYRRKFAYLPTKLHSNDFFPNYERRKVGEIIKIEISTIKDGKILALLENMQKEIIEELNSTSVKNLNVEKSENVNEKDKKKKQTIVETNQSEEKVRKNKNIKLEENTIVENNVNTTKKRKNSNNEENENIEIKKQKKRKVSENSEEEITNTEFITKEIIKKKKKKMKLEENAVEEKSADKSKKEKNSENEENKIEETKKHKTRKVSENSEEIADNEFTNNEITKKKKKKDKLEEIIITEKNADKSKKRKNSESEENKIEDTKKHKNRKISENSEEIIENGFTTKKTKDDKKASKKSEEQEIEDSEPILPGAQNFWNITDSTNVAEESSEDEKEEDTLKKQQKKKKMTAADKAKAARLEEEKIRKIEMELADAEAAPKTADQFDRLVLANPNNSMLWINYMAFHLEATEIEKARAIAQKALKTIEFREEQEKLNVWIALLNLENRYGTKESFDAVLGDAVQKNDSLSVYLQALNILADSKKVTDFTELLATVPKKFKQNFKMWTETAEACYKIDLKDQARNLMQRALLSLDQKLHVNLLVQFAFMESRYEEPERAEALLEKVLASYPRRVDVWTSYVDMLLKSNRIDIARNVLERAACQKLPTKKMKTIFTKYIQFESKYGDEEKVQKVQKLAENYVKRALK